MPLLWGIGRGPPFEGGDGEPGRYRVWGYVVPTPFSEHLIDFAQRELAQFGRYGFWPAPEGDEYSDETQAVDAPTEARVRRYPAEGVFHHPTGRSHSSEPVRVGALHTALRELREVVERLENGAAWDPELHHQGAIRSTP